MVTEIQSLPTHVTIKTLQTKLLQKGFSEPSYITSMSHLNVELYEDEKEKEKKIGRY